jgi:hypothetical protein
MLHDDLPEPPVNHRGYVPEDCELYKIPVNNGGVK